MSTGIERAYGLDRDGIDTDRIRWNLSEAALYEEAVRRGEAVIAANGPLACRTGLHTGRSPNDKFVAREPSSEANIAWGKVNRPMDVAQFDALHRDLLTSLKGAELFVQDCYAGADPAFQLPIRVINEFAWHNLFARNLFIVDAGSESSGPHLPEFTIIDSPSFKADPKRHGTNSDVVIALNFARKLVLIGGTSYAGEMKKSVFTILNYLLPLRNVLSMHCSANIGAAGDVALFFGLSGTGKTTLSSDPDRRLIGDDEHGWSDRGVFNFEGGCYAKTIHLSRSGEPQIWDALQFGSVLENVVVDPVTRRPDFEDDRHTENTRAAYPVEFIPHCELSGRGGHPTNIFFLACDAFGILPPIARLNADQAMYHFLSGYTAKVAGTEAGVTEPQATFSTCFAAPFLPLAPTRYAELLRERLEQHGSSVWLVNTGWSGGGYGVGRRMPLAHTRALLRAVLAGQLAEVSYEADPVFGVAVPASCACVPSEILRPRRTWADPEAYDAQAKRLAGLFHSNFQRFVSQAPAAVRKAGPRQE